MINTRELDLVQNFTHYRVVEDGSEIRWVNYEHLSHLMRFKLAHQLQEQGWQFFYDYGGDVVVTRSSNETDDTGQ